MPHPEIDNQTPFALELLFLSDEEGRPVVVPVIQGTFAVSNRGELAVAAEQPPIELVGTYNGEPGESSYRLEPQVAFMKPATDVVLLGHACAPRPGATQVDVGFRVGTLQKSARITGDRVWEKGPISTKPSRPSPFERIPLTYERAFGGWDRTPEKQRDHEYEPRNPVGVGLAAKKGILHPGTPVPNIEDPRHPLTRRGDRRPVVGFGFVCPDWLPRSALAGTYDEAWSKDRSPLLPNDFDRRFFNAASEGLVAPGYLQGDEEVMVIGATPNGPWRFQLPGVAPPACEIAVRIDGDRKLETNLDTVIVDADAGTVVLIWRAFAPLRTGPHDVSAVRISSENVGGRPGFRETQMFPAART